MGRVLVELSPWDGGGLSRRRERLLIAIIDKDHKVLTGSVSPAVKMPKLQRVVEYIGCDWSLAWAGSAKTKKAAL